MLGDPPVVGLVGAVVLDERVAALDRPRPPRSDGGFPGAPRVTPEALRRHAEKFGSDHVAEVAEFLGIEVELPASASAGTPRGRAKRTRGKR